MANDAFKIIGDWNKAANMSKTLRKPMEDSVRIGMKKIGLKAERIMVKWIHRQPSSWPALSSDYIALKKRKGRSNKMLISTSSMLNSIKSFTTKELAFAGVKRNTTNKDGEDVQSIAATMEFGSTKRGIPARPFVRPTKKIMDNFIVKRGFLKKIIEQRMRQKYNISI